MTRKTNTLLIFTCFILLPAAWCAGKEAAGGPEALISRARSQGDLWTEGTQPTIMRADLQVSDARGNLVHGDYVFYWVSPSQWREEIRFANYARIRVRDAKGYWQTSGVAYQPEVIFQVDKLLHLKDTAKVGTKQSLGKVRSEKNDGVLQNCTLVKWQSSIDRNLCFDEASGSLLSIDYPTGATQNTPEITRIEYSAFTAVAGKLVPYEIRALKGAKVVADVKVSQISKMTEENPALFTAPSDAEFWAQCDDIQEEELVNQVLATYPPGPKLNHEQGRVIIYAVIETDGSLSRLAIIQHVSPVLDADALAAVRQWRYKPASCGKMPIRTETSIATDFYIGP
jgi:TonB family protein